MRGLLRLSRHLVLAGACLATLLAGCQMPRAAKAPRHEPREKPAGKLTASQAADVQVAMGRSLESQGDLEGALVSYREAAKRDPKRADAPLRMAVTLDKMGRFAEAAPFYELALKASPGDPEIFCDRGYSLYVQSRYAEAETQFRQALARRPDLSRAHNNLGVLLGRTGRAGEALAEFNKAGIPEADAHLNLAFALALDLRWAEAKQHVAIARKLDPVSTVRRGFVMDLDRSIARAERALNPRHDVDVRQASLPPLPPLPGEVVAKPKR
jgi:Flp pilus assembly protein TadD